MRINLDLFPFVFGSFHRVSSLFTLIVTVTYKSIEYHKSVAMAMSRMEELPTPNSGTFAIQEAMSVGFTPMTDDGIVSPWLTKELERLFPYAPQRKYVSVLDTSLDSPSQFRVHPYAHISSCYEIKQLWLFGHISIYRNMTFVFPFLLCHSKRSSKAISKI